MREFTSAHERGEQAPTPELFLAGRMQDSGAVFVECSKGHRSAVVYNHHRYEVLFTSGTAAYQDGYSNEAVSTMAASLERAFEFFVRVYSRKLSIEPETIDAFWKLVSRQSERQLGAFLVLWLQDTGEPFRIPQDLTELRNKVLHQGYIPSESETHRFAEQVFALLKTIVNRLQATASHEISRERLREGQLQNEAIPTGMIRSSMAHSGINDSALQTFDEWLEKYRDMNSRFDLSREAEQGA